MSKSFASLQFENLFNNSPFGCDIYENFHRERLHFKVQRIPEKDISYPLYKDP